MFHQHPFHHQPPFSFDDAHHFSQIHNLRKRYFQLRHYDPRHMMMHAPFSPNRPGKRFFKRGEFKFAVLEFLNEAPMHGYELIKKFEEKTKGLYVPSAGSIYPTLQLLEDQGYVLSEKVAGKSQYSITEDGKAYLKEYQEKNHTDHAIPHPVENQQMIAEIHHETSELTHLIWHKARLAVTDPKAKEELLSFIHDMKDKIQDIGLEPDED
ncbi:Transcriptional regulator PadR-like family protein [Seinonella peptonophila]|uniref:Transcriptional regulator PadR-like family protein n=1 Tax=Seinonella peptonophila TaxID=112248 RepID=A0A1M4WH43_9BACL|nr:PadR family transcriptional regulator [Seinonella peptonophila]SHE80292.1 Transcriptional regulator PadR-like family protein [Seinonella peptonophila]